MKNHDFIALINEGRTQVDFISGHPLNSKGNLADAAEAIQKRYGTARNINIVQIRHADRPTPAQERKEYEMHRRANEIRAKEYREKLDAAHNALTDADKRKILSFPVVNYGEDFRPLRDIKEKLNLSWMELKELVKRVKTSAKY